MPIEVAFADLEEGKKYKLKEHYILTDEHQGYGTLQEDIDKLANRFYELTEIFEVSGQTNAEFKLNIGETVAIPENLNRNQRANTRDYIQIVSEALPDGDDTLFLEEEDEDNIEAPVNNGASENTMNANPTYNVINLTTSSGGRRRRRMSKKRKTRKQKRKSRKSKSKSRKH